MRRLESKKDMKYSLKMNNLYLGILKYADKTENCKPSPPGFQSEDNCTLKDMSTLD